MRTASRRRTIAPRAPREDAAPVSVRRTRSTAKRLDQLPDQENGDVNNKGADKAPSKHTLREEQGGSPTKINSHFRTSKLVESKPRESEGYAVKDMANEPRAQKRHPPQLNSRPRKSPASVMLCSIRQLHRDTGCKWEPNRRLRVLLDTLISLPLHDQVRPRPPHSLCIRKPGNCSLEAPTRDGYLVETRNERK